MPQRIHWSDEARVDVRTIEREAALQILKAVARFVETGAGAVKQLHGFSPPRYRLRIGDWRVVFRRRGEGVEVLHVRNRKEAYR
jgi:mRNA-degrading endonuclease RelE of RelBE toxin-antitoxin system